MAYIRVSTEDQALGPEAQRAAIENWAARQGVQVLSWHIDQGVGGAPEGPQRFERSDGVPLQVGCWQGGWPDGQTLSLFDPQEKGGRWPPLLFAEQDWPVRVPACRGNWIAHGKPVECWAPAPHPTPFPQATAAKAAALQVHTPCPSGGKLLRTFPQAWIPQAGSSPAQALSSSTS